VNIAKLSDEFGHYRLVIRCRRCGHTRVNAPEVLARRVGWDSRFDALVLRLRCSRCGAKESSISVQEAPHERRPRWH
jgi:DNA-directed RNA polymerase subunit RPC12/RpoP